jgi:DNA sulfur modification protein DndD
MWKKSGEKIKENFYVYVNDIFDEIITKDWDNFIEQILPAKVAQLFFFDGEKIEQLADLDQSKEVLRKAIDSLLGLEIVTRLNLDLGEFAKKSAVLSKDDKVIGIEGIEDGKKIKVKRVESMWGIGTPEDLETFLKDHKL